MQHSASIVDVSQFAADLLENIVPKESDISSPPFLAGFEKDEFVNVTSASAGAKILFATDEWFATADNLLKDDPPHFDPLEFCEQGKVMDGWETRRRRESGHDWCIIRLACRVHNIVGIEVDSAHFTGNNAPAISLEIADITSCVAETEMVARFPNALQRLLHGCVQGTGNSPSQVAVAEKACRDNVSWKELLPKTSLNPGYERSRMHYFTIQDSCLSGTHLRVNYFPDGGVARIRVWGSAMDETPSPTAGPAYSPISTGPRCTVVSHGSVSIMPSRETLEYSELSCDENGGIGLMCSNKHYGDPCNLIQSCFGRDMGDGWETARHPNRPHILLQNPESGLVDSPLSDWCVVKLGRIAEMGVARVILDTKHFRGNYPESVCVEGCFCPNDDDLLVDDSDNLKWFPLVDRVRMAPDSEHVFNREANQLLNSCMPVSHVRITIFPDGGLSRIRVYG
jgi:allantoicase